MRGLRNKWDFDSDGYGIYIVCVIFWTIKLFDLEIKCSNLFINVQN